MALDAAKVAHHQCVRPHGSVLGRHAHLFENGGVGLSQRRLRHAHLVLFRDLKPFQHCVPLSFPASNCGRPKKPPSSTLTMAPTLQNAVNRPIVTTGRPVVWRTGPRSVETRRFDRLVKFSAATGSYSLPSNPNVLVGVILIRMKSSSPSAPSAYDSPSSVPM